MGRRWTRLNEKQQEVNNMTILASLDGFLGTIWFTALVFVAGALSGAPLWSWLKQKFPWNQ